MESRTTIVDGIIHAWIYKDDAPWIEQSFNPIEGHPNWESEEQALAWADAFIAAHQEASNDQSA